MIESLSDLHREMRAFQKNDFILKLCREKYTLGRDGQSLHICIVFSRAYLTSPRRWRRLEYPSVVYAKTNEEKTLFLPADINQSLLTSKLAGYWQRLLSTLLELFAFNQQPRKLFLLITSSPFSR